MSAIARRNLFEDIPRFLVAQAGIIFAVSLVTIQTGVLNGFVESVGTVVDHAHADVWVANSDMVQLELTLPMPASNLSQAQRVEGVARAEPLVMTGGIWRSPGGEINAVRIFGFQPDGQLFNQFERVTGDVGNLKQPYTVMVDESIIDSLGVEKVNDTATLGSLGLTVVGLTQGTQSITSSPYLFTSVENAKTFSTANLTASLTCRLDNDQFLCTNVYQRNPNTNPPSSKPTPLAATDPISYILVRAKPGEDLTALKDRLEKALPGTMALTQTEMAQRTRRFWVRRTGVGFILGLGATVGAIVGIVIVGQILYSSVSDHMKEFATLKAMGVSDSVVYGIIIRQALWMGVLGYLPSLALCMALGAWTFQTQGIMILITPLTAIGVLGLTIFMCVGSAMFAIQKVTRVDPAIVFKS
jgi:putative ABC transport system permease protein